MSHMRVPAWVNRRCLAASSAPRAPSRRPRRRAAVHGPRVAHPCGHGPDPDARAARAPGARSRVRPRRPAAARGRVRARRWARPARVGRPDPRGGDRGRPARRLASARARRPGLDGRSSRSSSTSSSASRPAACGRTSRAPTTSWSTPTPTSAAATSTRRCAASARGATRSPRTAPAPTRGALRGHGGPRRRDRRVRPQRREVVRDRPRRHRLHDLPLPRRRRGASACRRSSWSTTTRPASSCSTTPTTRTRSPTGTRSSC